MSSRVLNVKGRVLPSTLAVARLCAQLTDGRVVEGETQITGAHGTIDHVYLDPPFAAPLDEVITALREADAIVLGPGSLYTSIMPNLLIDRVGREIEASNAVKIYVCNVMTQPGETDGYSASAHVRALLRGADANVCEVAVVNDELPRKLLDEYAEEGQFPVQVDEDELRTLGRARRARERDQRDADGASRQRPARGRGRRHHRRSGRGARDLPAPEQTGDGPVDRTGDRIVTAPPTPDAALLRWVQSIPAVRCVAPAFRPWTGAKDDAVVPITPASGERFARAAFAGNVIAGLTVVAGRATGDTYWLARTPPRTPSCCMPAAKRKKTASPHW